MHTNSVKEHHRFSILIILFVFFNFSFDLIVLTSPKNSQQKFANSMIILLIIMSFNLLLFLMRFINTKYILH